MSSNYVAGHGTTLSVSISSTLTPIGQITDVTPPNMTREKIDTTHLGSAWKELILAIPDGGEVEFEVEWKPKDTAHQYLWTSFEAGALESWEIDLSDVGVTPTKIAFTAGITEFPFDAINNETVVKIKFKLAISGAVTITPAT